MPASVYLADELLQAIQDEGLIPASDEVSYSPKLRRILNREQRLYLTALLQKCREEYQTDTVDIAVVSGQVDYDIPTRAVAAGIRRLEEVAGSSVGLLYPIDAVRNRLNGDSTLGTGDYHLQGNKLHLLRTPSATSSLRVVYPRRLNRVVAASECGEVSAINTGLKRVTLVHPDSGASSVPATFTTSRTYDFIKGTPHFEVIEADEAITTVASNVLTFTNSLPSGLAVGDFVALAGQTPVINAPLELQDVLVLKAAHNYLSSSGNSNNAGLAKERWQQAEEDALALMAPRVKDTPPLLINYHGPGWNRGFWTRRRRGM